MKGMKAVKAHRAVAVAPAKPTRPARPGRPAAKRIAIAQEILYLWRSARCCFILPVAFADNGVMRFAWRARWTYYTIIGWILFVPYMMSLVWLLYSRTIDRNQGKARTLQEMAQHATVTVIGAFTIVLPVPMFASMPGYARLTTGWRRMEAMYVALTGGPLVLGIKWLDYISGLLLIHAAVLSVTLAYQLGLPAWTLPPLVHAVYAMSGLAQIWISCFVAFAALAATLAGRMADDAKVRGAVGIRMHRLLWLQVVKMLQAFCESNSAVQLPHLLSMFVLCVAYFFSFVYTFLGNFQDLLSVDKPELLQGLWSSMVANTLLYITTGGAIFLICISAQVAINQIFLRARKSLLRMCISGQSEAMRTEIVYFLEDIDSRKPVVSLSGFLYVDRTTIVSAVVICTTYIVVLSQFTIQFA